MWLYNSPSYLTAYLNQDNNGAASTQKKISQKAFNVKIDLQILSERLMLKRCTNSVRKHAMLKRSTNSVRRHSMLKQLFESRWGNRQLAYK